MLQFNKLIKNSVIALLVFMLLLGIATVYAVTVVVTDDFDPDIDNAQWTAIVGGVADGTPCGAISGNALFFGGVGERSATTIDVDVSNGGTINFALILGDEDFGNPCDRLNDGEEVSLQYSTNAGTDWTTIFVYEDGTFTTFTPTSVEIPAGAFSAATRFRWIQTANGGAELDVWALDDVLIEADDPIADNNPPVLNAIGDRTVLVNTPLTFTATATDADVDDVLTFSLDAGTSGSIPIGATLNTTTGQFAWTPEITGDFTFDVVVSDGEAEGRETITVTVTESLPTTFALLNPANESTLRTVAAPVDFSWQAAQGAVDYTLTVLKLSNNTRIGLVAQITVDADTACGDATVCGQAVDLSMEGDGLFTWSVTATNPAGDVEARNAPWLFTVNSSPLELLVDNSFENGDPAWRYKGNSLLGDKVKCNKIDRPNGKRDKIFSRTEDCAAQLRGVANDRTRLVQNADTTNVTFFPGDVLTLNAWVDAANANFGRLRIKVKYTDGTPTDKFNIPVTSTIDGYENFTDQLTISSVNIDVVKVQILHNSDSGKSFVDDVSLILAPGAAVLPAPLTLPDAPETAPGLRG